ncbi:MAG TPA: DoxX family protein [Chloroflexota bacterium]|nr:DoxX family protein [Chloroflexota bacterium]
MSRVSILDREPVAVRESVAVRAPLPQAGPAAAENTATQTAAGERLEAVRAQVEAALARGARWLAPRSVVWLRLSLGLVFLGFGALKFVPGLSPAEDLVEQTVGALTGGLVPEDAGRLLVAIMETAVGLSLLTGRLLRLGLAVLGAAMVGILSPLVLFADQLFPAPLRAPTLEAQYVLKDVVLLSATLVVAAKALARRGPDGRAPA